MIANQITLKLFLLLYIVTCDSLKQKKIKANKNPDKTLWKQEYEDELEDAMLAKKQENHTKFSQSLVSDDDVIQKLLDTLTSSEKHMKILDSIDFKLNRLDTELHEKTNVIIRSFKENMKLIQSPERNEKLDATVQNMNKALNDLKILLHSSQRNFNDGNTLESSNSLADTRDYYVDSKMDVRLSHLEDQMKNILVGVDSIVSIISEVKSRQYNARTSSTSRPTDAIGSTEMATLINEFKRTLYEQKAKKCDCRTNIGRVDRSERYPTDCQEIQLQGFNISGIYKIKPDEMEPFYVLCDLSTSGGEWTVFQNRFDGSQDFFRNWIDYKHGFGNLAGEFWLGLEKLHYLTNQKLYELRIEMESPRGLEAYAAYSVFTIGPEHEGYRISTLGTYHGNAGDSLSYHAGQKFSTVDVDNDEWKDGACTAEHGGAWWYKECDKSNLNGKYASTAEENRGQSIYWVSFKGPNFPLSKTKMMIRPLPASRPNDYTEQNRKLSEIPKLNQLSDRMKYRSKDLLKGTYNLSHLYRYGGDYTRAEPFLSNYT